MLAEGLSEVAREVAGGVRTRDRAVHLHDKGSESSYQVCMDGYGEEA